MSKLPDSLAAILGSSINRYLALDPGAQDSIAVLENKSVTLNLKEFSFPVFFLMENKRIKVLPEYQEKTDVSLSTSLPGLLQMTLFTSDDESILGSEIDMTGDMEVGRRFRDIFKKINIDWEEILSNYTGDIFAHKMGNVFRQFNHWIGNTRQTIQLDITEYLQEESRQLPSEVEIESYVNAVGELRLSVERAEARLKLIAKQMGSAAGKNSFESER